MLKENLCKEVTESIVLSLENGVEPWKKSWDSATALGLPKNFATGSDYHGINTVILWALSLKSGYPTHEWATYNQISAKGGNVRKGEKGSQVMFFKSLEIDGETVEDKKVIPMAKLYTVFNKIQCENLGPVELAEPKELGLVEARELLKNSGADILHGFTDAYYNVTQDSIRLPPEAKFDSEVSYLTVAMHELIHWTGHESRLDRLSKSRSFGDQAYAFEELVAEIGAAFLCAHLNIPNTVKEHASYIDGWVKLLKLDHNAIFKAAAMANKACSFLLDGAQKKPNVTEQTKEAA